MKTAIVFGAGGEVGKIIQGYFNEKEFRLTLCSRSCEKNNSDKQLNLPCDISNIENVDSVFHTHKKHWGFFPEVVINAAAIQGPIGKTWEIDDTLWKKSFDINFHGPFNITKTAINVMNEGRIFHFSGGGAVFARPQFSAYACAKTALLRLVENVAEELKTTDKKIIINAIAPGTIKSKMTEAVLQAGDVLAGEKGFKEAQDTWNLGGTNPKLITNLLDFLLGETLPQEFSGRLVHVKEPYREFIKNNPESLPVDIGKLRRIGL